MGRLTEITTDSVFYTLSLGLGKATARKTSYLEYGKSMPLLAKIVVMETQRKDVSPYR